MANVNGVPEAGAVERILRYGAVEVRHDAEDAPDLPGHDAGEPPSLETQGRGRRPDPLLAVKSRVHARLLADLKETKTAAQDPEVLRATVHGLAGRALDQETGFNLGRDELEVLTEEVVDAVLGLGPLEPLLRDASISEVMVNGPDRIFFERAGRIHRSDRAFRDDAHVMLVVERILAPLGRRVDEQSPMTDARLADGSRVNIIIPPLAVDAPVLTIRKFSREPLTVAKLVELGTLTVEMADVLQACVAARLNIVVSGGTGSGKTTFLNVLSGFIDGSERIVTIEDPAELQLRQEHVVRLETRPPGILGQGEVRQRELVRNALRMRPDRIIVGEVRGAEAFDMLQAMNTGHDGSLTTVHANSPRDALARIQNMVLMAGLELPERAIKEQIVSAVNLVIQLSRFADGSRRVTHVAEVTGMEGQMISMQDIFVFDRRGVGADGQTLGSLRPSGLMPTFLGRLERSGLRLRPELFQSGKEDLG